MNRLSDPGTPSPTPAPHRRVLLPLLLLACGMFGFGFLLVPLYEVFCEVTGLNGKTGGRFSAAGELEVDAARRVVVQFVTINNASMPWGFRPGQPELRVRPGEVTQISFSVTNPTAHPMVAQAVPSVSPSAAARYFHKVQCFCFERQLLQPGESQQMPLQFVVDPALPEHVAKLTLSYTLFDITEKRIVADLGEPQRRSGDG